MKKSGVLAIAAILIGGLFTFLSCEQSTSSEIAESFEKVKEVTPIAGAQNAKLDLQRGTDQQDSFFTVTLNDGSSKEGWCLEWNEPSVQGVQEGVELFTTRGKEAWKELNYFMSIKDDLRADDPELTYKEIQVIIWSLVDNPSFDVDKISEYENIDNRIYTDGQPQFDVQKVKNVVSQVKQDVNQAKNKWLWWDFFLIFIKNEGQTIMTKGETAYAFYNNEKSTCFTDIEGLSSKKWGWSNGPLVEGKYEFDMYAGAGQCDINKGTLVGKLLVDYADGRADITFQMTETSDFTDELYTMTTTHLYVGNDILPMKDGSYTDAPGQYGNVDSHDNVTEFSYSIDGLSGDIYVVGHADVNGFEGEED